MHDEDPGQLMAPALSGSLGWARTGTELFLGTVDALEPTGYDQPSELPGWTRKHLVAHVAANADALGNLAHWAATGDETPMYSSAQQRADDIERGALRSADELRSWVHSASERLAASLDALDDTQWQRPVRTAQGRTVAATEVPWLRSREVYVHSVDMGTGVTFAEMPEGFLHALIADICGKRGLAAVPDGPLPEVAAYLAGRPNALVGAPELGPWL